MKFPETSCMPKDWMTIMGTNSGRRPWHLSLHSYRNTTHFRIMDTGEMYGYKKIPRGLCMLVFLAKLIGLETWATNIGNAYLETKTKERVYIHAGPKFGELEGHTLVIFKALYGLHTSGLRWHE
jgi:hypothetical protein